MINLQQLCMNAGTELPMDYIIRYNLKNNYKFFENIYIADGHFTDKAKQFYSQFPNVHGLDLPWEDSYVKQYIVASKNTQEGSWVLHLDADELPSESLLQRLIGPAIDKAVNLIRLPCILHLTEDGKHFYPVEPDPEKTYSGQWTKPILFKKEKSLDFRFFGSHVLPNHGNNEKAEYWPFPYFHFKTLQSFVENDVFQCFLSPPGQGYNNIETIQFQTHTRHYGNTSWFKLATQEGKWPLPLQKFAYDHRNDLDRPISRLYIYYHILLGHPCFKEDESLTWDAVKQHIQSEKVMKLFEYNKSNKIGEIIIEKDF